MEQDERPGWCFRLRWLPEGEDPFLGRVDAVLVARTSELGAAIAEIEDLVYADASPLANLDRFARAGKLGHRKQVDELALTHGFFRGLRGDDYDVAVSSSGADKESAELMVNALQNAGLRVNWYRLPECRSDERDGVLGFMNTLKKPTCIVLLVSADYLRHDPLDSWYCPWELADAINQIQNGKRTVEQTVVVFLENDEFKFSRFNQNSSELFRSREGHFQKAFANLSVRDWDNFEHYQKFARFFFEAQRTEAWQPFFDARGSLGNAIGYESLPMNEDGQRNFDKVIRAVRQGVRKRGRQGR